MQILELESKTGLDRATIRHYEKEGLISPTRRENGYRDYTEENVNDLLKIKLLRQLGLSLDKIRRIQQETDNIQLDLDAMSLGKTQYEEIKLKYCMKCGAELLPNARFCIKCGTHIGHSGLAIYSDGEG